MKIKSSNTFLNRSLVELKPFKFPGDFVVIIDTREKKSLFYNNIDGYSNHVAGLEVNFSKLENGDYSVSGFEDNIFIERKCFSDLILYVGKDHKKTEEKLKRIKDYQFKALVIEEKEEEILNRHFSDLSPEVIRQSLASWEVKYGLNIYYNRDRKNIERWLLDRMLWFYRIKRNGG